MSGTNRKPAWWSKNEDLKATLDLPPYEPSRFRDGTYVHEVVPELEEGYGVDVRFVGVDPRYPEAWQVRVDGEGAFSIGRQRDDSGNTVYTMTATEFRTTIEAALG